VALLKRSILSPDNEFVAPSVYTMEISERTAIVSLRLGRPPGLGLVATTGASQQACLLPPSACKTLPRSLCSLPQSSTYLQNGQAMLLPDDASANLAPSSSAELSNSSVWLGCIVAQAAVMEGSLVAVLDGIENAEQCCRRCREWPDGECNVFNFCPATEGCRWVLRGPEGLATACKGWA